MILFLLFTGMMATAQPAMPTMTVRFANPVYDCPTQTYCLDVQFKVDPGGLQLFGMNVRFFYDGSILQFLSIGEFQNGYEALTSEISTFPGQGPLFGLSGPLKWFNGTVQMTSPSTIFLSNTDWTTMFHICFRVLDPVVLEGVEKFCPAVIWDMQMDPSLGGYLPGDDGDVMTIVDPDNPDNSLPTISNVVQFNWEYNPLGEPFGNQVDNDCVDTRCGYHIPLANWSLFLAIGLMIVTTLFIYRRRISG